MINISRTTVAPGDSHLVVWVYEKGKHLIGRYIHNRENNAPLSGNLVPRSRRHLVSCFCKKNNLVSQWVTSDRDQLKNVEPPVVIIYVGYGKIQ